MGRNIAYYQIALAVTSVIIPCYHGHFRYIPHLLQAYAEQTKVPDEVVIALSEADKVSTEDVEQTLWPFSLVLLKADQKLFPGENRNRGVAHAKGDLLIFQDADDLPHPQRVEIIEWFFEKYACNHLLHGWISPKEKWQIYDHFSEIEWKRPTGFLSIDRIKLHHGSAAMKKAVAEKYPWNSNPLSEDRAHTTLLYNHHLSRRMVILADLLCYHNERSSYSP